MKDTKHAQLATLEELLREFTRDQKLSLEISVRHEGVKAKFSLQPSTARALLRIGINDLRTQIGATASSDTFKSFIGRALSK